MKNEYIIDGSTVVIKCFAYGEIWDVLVSIEDFEQVDSIPNRWYVGRSAGLLYAYYNPYINGRRAKVQLHQFLMGTFGSKFSVVVDHINGETLDNRRENLQLVTQKENVRKARLRHDNRTGYKHIQWQESRKKYRVEVHRNGEYFFVGRFVELDNAVKARDEFLEQLERSEVLKQL